MPAITLILLSVAVSHLLLLGFYILLYHRNSAIGILSGLLVFSLTSALLGENLIPYTPIPISDSDPLAYLSYITMVLNRIGNVSAILIWLLALKLFEDSSQLRKIHPVVWLVAISALIARGIGSYYAYVNMGMGLVFYTVTWGYSQVVLAGFILAAIAVAVKGYRSDLVLTRRVERVVFFLSVSILLMFMAANRGVWVVDILREGTPYVGSPPLTEGIYSLYAYLVTMAIFLWKFRISDLSVSKSSVRSSSDSAEHSLEKRDLDLMDSIRQAMEVDRLYQRPKLTVAGLADYVESQEYKVRRAINFHLGYRNFSDFLNYYRIGETCQLLAETERPISNVSYDVGYTSLSSFYNAFKAIHSITPKEYRALHKQ